MNKETNSIDIFSGVIRCLLLFPFTILATISSHLIFLLEWFAYKKQYKKQKEKPIFLSWKNYWMYVWVPVIEGWEHYDEKSWNYSGV